VRLALPGRRAQSDRRAWLVSLARLVRLEQSARLVRLEQSARLVRLERSALLVRLVLLVQSGQRVRLVPQDYKDWRVSPDLLVQPVPQGLPAQSV